MRDSEKSRFRPHDDLGQLNKIYESHYFHTRMRRSTTYVPGKALHSKPNINLQFVTNPPKDELGLVD